MTDAELDQCRRNGELLRSIIEEKVKLKRNAPTRWVGYCPFHDEKTPSFTVYADGHFHCYGCREHGSVFDYVMRRDGIEFPEAVKIIEEQLGFATGASPKRKPNGTNAARQDDTKFHAIIPPPKDAPAPLDQLNGRFQPFEYVTSNGETHHYQRRIDQGDGKKMFLPLTYGMLNGATGWHAKAPPQPWPLYRLDLLRSADPDSWVIIVEGEGKCEAAERMFPGYVCTAWMNGAGSVDCSDWEILKRFREERLIWWSDADRPSADGRPHGCFIAEPAFRKIFPRASYIDTTGLSERKDGFDAGDLEADLGDEDPSAWLKARLRTTPPPGGATSGGGFTGDGSPPGGDARSEGDPGPRPGNGSTGQNAASFRDPWDQPPPPEWPSGILPARFAEMIAALATGSGVDPGVVAISALLAISGAAPKNCRLKPYGDNHSFVVPPILWAMSVASSGQRKTYLNEVFAALKHHRNEAWHNYQIDLADWNALDKQSKKETPKPREPFSCLVQDITPEKLAEMLAENDRGTLYQRDELSSFFGFGRYSNDRGAYERSLYLEAYDGDQFLSQRITRAAAYVKHTAVSVFGSIQPRRLQKLSVDDLGADGLLQRFIVIMPRKVSISQSPDTNMGVVPGRAEFNRIVAQLLDLGSLFGREFRATPDGAQIIYRLEELGLALGEITDYGPVFPEFCAKLHGTAARLALVLHFLDNPAADMNIVMPETIARADRLVREYVLPHGRNFYAEISEEGPERTRAIAAWLLSGAPDRITASDFGKHVRPCRGLRLRDLNNALDPLVGGGWLIPENPYPSNNAWTLDTNVRTALAHRVAAATAQRERNRQLAESIGPTARRSG